MLIELTIRRQHGTRVNVLGTDYHFTSENEDEPHVAEVLDSAHVEHFLSIGAFREFTKRVAAPPRKPIRPPKGTD